MKLFAMKLILKYILATLMAYVTNSIQVKI